MTRRSIEIWPITLLLSVLFFARPVPASAQWAVFDASNYAQNIIQAARTLQQINNQIQALQNQALMLQNMAKNLQRLDFSSLDAMTSDLTRVGSLMNEAQGIRFDVNATRSAFAQTYPQRYAAAVDTNQLVADAHTRWQNAMDAFQQTLVVQAQVAENVQSDTATLASLTTVSQGAVGALQAQQATNQLIALATKQQLQIQTLMAAQYRASALDQARSAEAEEAARAATSRFLGTSTAYTPH